MDKKIFVIQIDGIEKSYNDVLSLVDALKQLDNSNTTVTASTPLLKMIKPKNNTKPH